MARNASDHAFAVIKAALNAVPVIGGPLASLIGDYIPMSTQRSIEKATELMRDQLVRLEGRIDADVVDKDEFSDLFKSCYLVVVRTTREEKLRAVAAIMANLLLKPGDPAKVSYAELDHLVRSLDALSIGALVTLGAAIRAGATTRPDSEGNTRLTFGMIHAQLPEMDTSLLMGLGAELHACHFLHILGPAIRMPNYENHAVELTSLGRRFAEQFIEGKLPCP